MTRTEPKRCQLCGATGVLQRIGSQLVCVRLSCQDEARRSQTTVTRIGWYREEHWPREYRA